MASVILPALFASPMMCIFLPVSCIGFSKGLYDFVPTARIMESNPFNVCSTPSFSTFTLPLERAFTFVPGKC